MKKFLFALAFLVSVLTHIKARNYENSFGCRAGFSNGLNFKYFFSTKNAVEIIFILRRRGPDITGLYEKHFPVITKRMYFYYGAGAHIGFRYSDLWNNYTDPTIFGIDGVTGLEYVFAYTPLCISLDSKPSLNLIGNSAFRAIEFSLSFRYLF